MHSSTSASLCFRIYNATQALQEQFWQDTVHQWLLDFKMLSKHLTQENRLIEHTEMKKTLLDLLPSESTFSLHAHTHMGND